MLFTQSYYHKDLTKAQWKRIKFVFGKRAKVGSPSLNPRTVFNAILWILKSGARWRNLPARYGNRNSIYYKFRLWCSLGLFERLLQLINADVWEATLLEMDSTFCKVHQSACSALKGSIAWRQKHQSPRPYQGQNATFERSLDRRASSRL